jgi:hypothetical protein
LKQQIQQGASEIPKKFPGFTVQYKTQHKDRFYTSVEGYG